MRHSVRVSLADSGQTEKCFDHMEKALARCCLHAHPGISVGCIPPVVPDIWFDCFGFSSSQDARLSILFDGQFTVKNGKALDHCGVTVFASDARPDARDQLGDGTAFGILIGKLDNGGALTGDRIFPDLSDLDRGVSRKSVRVRARHENSSSVWVYRNFSITAELERRLVK